MNRVVLIFVVSFALCGAELLFQWSGVMCSSCDTYDDFSTPMLTFFKSRGEIHDKRYNVNVDYATIFNNYYTNILNNVTLRKVDRRIFPKISYEVALKLYTHDRLLTGYGASNISFSDAYTYACYGLLNCGSLIDV